jgi:hypothetical protein
VGLKLLYAYISTGCILNTATGVGGSGKISAEFLPLRSSYNSEDNEWVDDGLCLEYASFKCLAPPGRLSALGVLHIAKLRPIWGFSVLTRAAARRLTALFPVGFGPGS